MQTFLLGVNKNLQVADLQLAGDMLQVEQMASADCQVADLRFDRS